VYVSLSVCVSQSVFLLLSAVVGIKEFSTSRVILITPKDKLETAKQAKKELEKFQIPTQIKQIEGNLWEEMFRVIAEIKKIEKDIIINVATGDRMTRCAATSAAFVNGIKAFDVTPEGPMLLPVLKFNYYKMITDKKMQILRIVYTEEKCCASLEELSKKTKMSLPLISYHINGNLKSEGLKDLGLVKTSEKKGKVAIELTKLGRLLLKGYVK